MSADASVLFVGESPPPGAAADFVPFDCASGTRLATIMLGLTDRATMLAHVPRANIYDTPTGVKKPATSVDLDLYTPPWDPTVAAIRGLRLLQDTAARTVVALGRRTAEALGMPDVLRLPAFNWAPPLCATWTHRQSDTRAVTVLYAPHPSGASATLNDPTTRAEVRAMLMPELIIGVPSLRPWHFNLADPSTLAALSAALAPLCPALAAAALIHADGMHKANEARASIPLLARMSAATTPTEQGQALAAHIATERPQPWNAPLADAAAILLRPDGRRALEEHWGASNLARLAKANIGVDAAQSRSAMRATLARYAAAGLTC